MLLIGLGATIAAADTAVKGDGGTIRLMVNMAGTQSYPPFVMDKLGLESKYGFVLKTMPSATTQTTTTGFQSGDADMGMMGWNDLSRIIGGGVKVVGIAPFLGWANTVVVPVDSSIHNLGDLKGKKVGVYSRTGLDWVVMRANALKLYKLDLEKDIVVQEGAISLLRGLMEQNQLDAAQMFNDLTAPMVVSGKYRSLGTIQSLVTQLGLPDMPFLMYAVSTDYVAAHPENVKAFLAAYRDSIDALEKDNSLWAERAKQMGMSDDETIGALRDQTRPMLASRFKSTDEAAVRQTWDILVATAGAQTLGGMTKLANHFMTLEYQ
ncbi:MAG TPA: ABC transporter substrate-binding protein [Stellaceae bacterium]|jgi:ABC-type nitrate/sulfonate/bicarbonate transport system substrate-binding protein|nr:ABC transporter substrate-binding protein [Stellaceae bacterium]